MGKFKKRKALTQSSYQIDNPCSEESKNDQKNETQTRKPILKKMKVDSEIEEDFEQNSGAVNIFAMPKTPKIPQTTEEKIKDRRVIVVLEKAALEIVKTKRGYELLNVDDHKGLLKKHNKDPSLYRPDILHHCMLTLLDSPLNKAGFLQIYIRSRNNVLIKVHPSIRLPRTFNRFCGLMVQLLHKFSIHASDGNIKLMKVVKNPVTRYFMPNCRKFGTSVTGDLMCLRKFLPTFSQNEPVVWCFGTQAHGIAEVDWVEKYIAVSSYPLSAAAALGRLVHAYEEQFDIM